MRRVMVLLLVTLLALSACEESGENGTTPKVEAGGDRGPADLGASPEATPDAEVVLDLQLDATPNLPRWEYVISALQAPATAAESKKFALIFKGQKYNALGDTLASMTTLSGVQTVQELISAFVNRGDGLILLRLFAKDLTSAVACPATVWSGLQHPCCKAGVNEAQCAKAAAAGCYGGSATFTLPSNTLGASISGVIKATGKLWLGPAKLRLKLPLFDAKPLYLTLKYATISGVVDKNGVTSGVLSGAVTASDYNNKVKPSLVILLDKLYKHPKVSQAVKSILAVLDLNKDGHLTWTELEQAAKGSPLLGLGGEGDVDVDGDGQDEWSMGFGFTAVPCSIK